MELARASLPPPRSYLALTSLSLSDAHFVMLGELCYFERHDDKSAIEWLEGGHPYSTGSLLKRLL